MKLRSLVVFAFIALSFAAAQAQLGLYVNPVFTSVRNSKADPGTFSFLGPGTTERVFGGVDFGAYYDAVHANGLGLGLELRDEVLDGNGASLNNFFAGARISYKPKTIRFHPYVEPVIGLGYSEAPNTGIHVKKITYGALAGVDYPLAKHIDFRVLEVGYSTLATASDGTVGGTISIPKSTLVSFSTGFVFRFF